MVGGAYNAPLDNDGGVIVIRSSEDEGSVVIGGGMADGGIQTYRQAGANYNTTRIKGMETTAAANYNHSFIDSRSRSERNTFITGGNDIFTETENKRFTYGDNAKVSFEIKNTERKKFLFSFEPVFRYSGTKTERYNENSSRQRGDGLHLNSATASNYGESRQFSHNASFTFGIKGLGDKRRNITLSGYYSLSDQSGDNREFSQTFLQDPAAPATRDLFYMSGTRNYSATARLSYVEPLAEKWTLSFNLNSNGTWRNYGKDAFERSAGQAGFNASVLDKKDYTRKNDYYSSSTDNRYILFYEILQLQYKKNATSLQFGAQMQETLNETRARSLGHDTETGLGEWLLDWSPYFNLRWMKQQRNFNFSYSGRSIRPTVTRQLPVLDISVPTRLQLGNIYLRPAYSHSLSSSIYSNNPQKQLLFNLFMDLSLNQRQTVTASWFDEDGIQYAIPVNSAKPSLRGTLYAGSQIPLTKDKRLRLSASLSGTINRAVS
ncbi:MAG: hypothetical protein IJL93_03085, partial [Bacteroidales bacterium]|nr:hypothetical protein [Bacteroidales bacterium]